MSFRVENLVTKEVMAIVDAYEWAFRFAEQLAASDAYRSVYIVMEERVIYQTSLRDEDR